MNSASLSSVVFLSVLFGCVGESAQTSAQQVSAQTEGANVQGVACKTEQPQYFWNTKFDVFYEVLRAGDASFTVRVFAHESPANLKVWGQLTLVKSAESSDYTSTSNPRLAILEKKPGEFTLEHKMKDSDTTPKVSARLTCLSSPISPSSKLPGTDTVVDPVSESSTATGEPSNAEYQDLKACIASNQCEQDGCEFVNLTDTNKRYCVSTGTILLFQYYRCGGKTLTG